MNKILKVKCPQCETMFSYYDSESRPFCSERCKLIDLGHWFEESYRVPEKKSEREREQFETNEYGQENSEETSLEEIESEYEH